MALWILLWEASQKVEGHVSPQLDVGHMVKANSTCSRSDWKNDMRSSSQPTLLQFINVRLSNENQWSPQITLSVQYFHACVRNEAAGINWTNTHHTPFQNIISTPASFQLSLQVELKVYKLMLWHCETDFLRADFEAQRLRARGRQHSCPLPTTFLR